MKNPYYRKPNSKTKPELTVLDLYTNFLDTMIKKGYVIGLYNEGWALCATHTGQQGFSIWSHKNLATLLIKGDWENFKTQKITLKMFLEQVIPHLKAEKYILSLNLTPEGQNLQLNPEKMLLDLKTCLYALYTSKPDAYAKLDLPVPRKIRIH